MKDKSTICHFVRGKGCASCGGDTFSKPCHLDIPDHIPDKQINRYVRLVFTERIENG